MNNRLKWINRQIQLGWALLVAGLVIAVVGILLPRLAGSLSFNPRIITGLGILLLGIGTAFLVRYGAARRDPQAALRLASEERDERMRLLRARAGNKAFWVSAAMAYAVLMWLSFAGSGSLPQPSLDTLWYALAAVVVVPFGVYAASLAYDQGRS
jgi:ABC-type uncharacterized transport system permease subunit